jgi:phosphopantetheine adenylyltransferase
MRRTTAIACAPDVDSDAKGEQIKENATPEQEQYLFKLAENYDIKAMTKSKNMIVFSKETLQKAKEILNQKGNK